MKKYILFFALFVSLTTAAQDFRGIAEYESKVIVKWQSENDLEAEQNEQIKKAMENKYTLKFDKFTSLYEKEEKLARPTSGGTWIVYSGTQDDPQFKDLKNKQYIIATDIYDKDFLIVDSLKQLEWEMTGETKMIGNYTCYKAAYVVKAEPKQEEKPINLTGGPPEEDKVITAWYTPDIPVSHGPDGYWGLPGLILEVHEGQRILLCSKLTLNPDKKPEVKAPKKGTKVTRAEFDAIKQRKDKERN